MVTIRAAVALTVLGGYWAGRYLVAVALLLVTGWTWVADPGVGSALLTLVTAVALGLSVRAADAVHRAAHREPVGVVHPPGPHSPLWSDVREICARLQVRVPDEIRLGTDPVVEVWEQSRRFGLAAGPRHLYVGLPVLVALPVAQVRALLTHELAHDLRDAGNLRAVCLRARGTVGRILQRRPGTAGLVFTLVGRLFLALDEPVSRDQERRADRAAVWLNGRAGMASALRELPVVGVAWRRYLDEVIEPAARSGYAPLSISDGFNHTRRDWHPHQVPPGVGVPEPTPPPWDAHPSRSERMHAIESAPQPRHAAPQPEWQARLVPAISEVERQVVGGEVRRVPWEEFRAITEAERLREDVAELYRVAGTVAARNGLQASGPADVDTVLLLIEARAMSDLIAGLHPASVATARTLLALAFAQTAVDGGLARWRRTASGSLQVVRPDGGAVPVDELAARVIADPSTVPVVREVLRAVQVGTAPVRS